MPQRAASADRNMPRDEVAIAGLNAERVFLLGVELVPWTERDVVEHVFRELSGGAGHGGWIVTPNTHILRDIVRDPSVRSLIDGASLLVADGMVLVWASRMQRTALPERVTGASLLWSMCAEAARTGRSVFLIGGAEGVADAAALRLRATFPGLEVGGWSPPFGIESRPEGMDEIRRRVSEAAPDLVFSGFGFPKQERVIAGLRPELPDAWFIGCGAALAFAAGHATRAPGWMQRAGLEWVHRLISEPRRMFRRYVIDDIPFALRLFAHALRQRGRSSRGSRR